MRRSRLWFTAGVLLFSAVFSGCYAYPEELSITETPEPTATLTSTPVWFPPTATPTLLPTQPQIPTPDLRPSIGELLLEDAFEAQDEWRVFTGTIGKINFTGDHITLAINQPKGMIYAFRESPNLTDFYAEVTADVNLCSGDNEYGLMLRVSGIRSDHYRFALTCSGQVKVVRVYGTGSLVLRPLESFPSVPVGFPSRSVLGVWVVGGEMRFFLNDLFLFSVTDPVITSGSLGVYTRTIDDAPMSVNFSQVEIYSIQDGS